MQLGRGTLQATSDEDKGSALNEHGDISWKDLEGGDERRGRSRSPKRAPEAKDDKDAVGEDKTDYEGLIRSLSDPASP